MKADNIFILITIKKVFFKYFEYEFLKDISGIIIKLLKILQKPINVSVGHNYSIVMVGSDIYEFGTNPECRIETIQDKLNEIGQFESFSCGRDHVCGITKNGLLYGWGSNSCGQLGITLKQYGKKNITNTKIPQLMMCNTIIAVACGYNHTLILNINHKVLVCGNNSYGQLALPYFPREPHIISMGLMNCIAISCGTCTSAAITKDLELVVWGKNDQGQLGLGNNFGSFRPFETSPLENVIAIKCQQEHMIALTTEGDIYVWGLYLQDNLGLDVPNVATSPHKLNFTNINLFDSTLYNLFLVTSDGELYYSGKPTSDSPFSYPMKQLIAPKVKQIVCGSDSAIIVTTYDEIYQWYNGHMKKI